MRALLLLIALLTMSSRLVAQFDLEESHTNASLRGIDTAEPGVAWASGANGTILRTEDGGYLWQKCAPPEGGETLDFRGVQAFNANTAVVMSSGKGKLSRVYKTTDGCATWKLVFEDPDAEGFFDALRFDKGSSADHPNACFGEVVGDPVGEQFPIFLSFDCGGKWERQLQETPRPLPGEGLFAASNSSLVVIEEPTWSVVTGGSSGPRVLALQAGRTNAAAGTLKSQVGAESLPHKLAGAAVGAFSIACPSPQRCVIVGGDYQHPDQTPETAWYDDSGTWKQAVGPPHGYRSAVAYDGGSKRWITVGPNGTDQSHDDGRHWSAVKPGPGDAADADKGWNAMALPFVVGANGRIGKLKDGVLSRPGKN